MLYKLQNPMALTCHPIHIEQTNAFALVGDGYLCGLFLDAACIPSKFKSAPISSASIDILTLPMASYMVSDFKHAVYEQLLKIPRGSTKTYHDIAIAIGKPKACRAVGTAVAKNDIAILIPCHRVVPKAGDIGQYLYGSTIKKKLLDAESTRLPEKL
jgi:O-6-methylguanine DNA methyltransferase